MALSKLFSRLILQLAKHSPASAASPQPATTDGKQLCSPLQCTLAADVYRWISLQRRPISQSTAPISSAPPIRVRIPVGDKLIERIRSSMRQEHGRFDGISPPQRGLESNEIAESPKVAISVEDARKLLKASRVEAVRARLRAIPSSCVPYTHFAQICREAAGGVDAFGREIEASLDKSGAVVIVGDVVLLRPEQAPFPSLILPFHPASLSNLISQ
ncbi:hypothetical protein HPP92_007634 [Vanilla planifolia]|uniref:Calcium uniporter protein n=1 Tax=Vanilla planifolia TaxID=51239 RepID=A0A835RKV2_VANPL|nr:hypothetical protein HPP92_007702 [Vanilla planifolia]KAG0490771.1 hypothetical protein HPP92_007634 [Vanilla planifolia]